jgi:hypothetical protein
MDIACGLIARESLEVGMRKLRVQQALSCLFACAIPAYATSVTTFVSATGSDSNPCTQAKPCATFQGAINQTTAGGEVDAMTPGNYQSFVVNNSITIDGKGMASVNESDGQAIAINEYATSDAVVLRGLTIVGDGTGVEGIYYPGGGSLVVENCLIAGFTYDGIVNVTNGNSFLLVKDTTINGGATGIYINEDGGTTILNHVNISGATSYGVEVLNSPGTLEMDDSTISLAGLGVYGVDIQSSAYYGTSYFNAMLERDSISGATTAALYVGVGSSAADQSTFFSNSGVGLVASGTGSTIYASNNNFYTNGTTLQCSSGGSISSSENRGQSTMGTSCGPAGPPLKSAPSSTTIHK